MSAIAQCDGCGWQTPGENTGSIRGMGMTSLSGHRGWPDAVVPIRDCSCAYCYRGAWTHVVRPEDEPGFLRYVTYGMEPRNWHDYCPDCTPPPGWRSGLPLSWKIARLGVRLAAILGGLAFWSHVILGVGR